MNNLISVGDKIELRQMLNQIESSNENVRTYISQILDINEFSIQAAMPIYEGHLIPLEVGIKYDVFFKTSKGLYKAVCEVIARSKVEKIYMLELKPITDLERFQRREYFRLSTNVDASICSISELEMKNYIHSGTIPEDYIKKKKNAIFIDISGGGAKIVSSELYKINDMLLIEFNVTVCSVLKNIIIPGKVLTSVTSNNRLDLHEHRVEYYKIPKETRELIIKYIFDEQRRIRQKERG